MKKVLLVAPRPSSKGGICVWVGMVLDNIDSYKETVSLDLLDSTRSVSLTHLLPCYKRIWYSIIDYLRVLFKLLILLIIKTYDIVHITSSGGTGLIRDFIFVVISRLFKVKPIVHFHCGSIPITLSENSIYTSLLHYIVAHSIVLVLDDATLKALRKRGYKEIYKIGNPYNPYIDEVYDSEQDRNPLDLLFVGHLVPEKGIRELIEAIASIPNIHLTCIGHESIVLKKNLQERISFMGLDYNVDFLGLQTPQFVYDKMVKAGLFVLPTYTEGFPFVVVEAMAAGCPIIATPVGAIEEMLMYDGELQGCLVKPRNVSDLSNAIKRCIESYSDVRLKAIKARAKAQRDYSVDAIISQLILVWTNS